jgi:hypothetical protein
MHSIAAVLLLVVALVAATPAFAQYEQGGSCGDKNDTPPDIALNVEIPDPYYNLEMSGDEINAHAQATVQEWLKKNNMSGIWSAPEMHALGYASGGAGMTISAGFKAVPYDVYGAVYCPFFSKLEINFIFRTMIVMPKEFKDQPCRLDLVRTHELRHYYANKHAVELYVKKLRHDFPAIVAEVEKEPVSRDQVEGKFEDMKLAIRDIIEVYFSQGMGKEMQKLNGEIDSPEEYEIRGLVQHDCDDSG